MNLRCQHFTNLLARVSKMLKFIQSAFFWRAVCACGTRVFCMVGSIAQFLNVNFGYFAYCILPKMCYTIITEGDKRAKTFSEIVGYVIQLRVGKQLDKAVADMKITPDGNSQKNS